MEYMLQFQHTGGRDRDFSENSRLAWFTEQISEQPRLHRESLKNFGGGEEKEFLITRVDLNLQSIIFLPQPRIASTHNHTHLKISSIG